MRIFLRFDRIYLIPIIVISIFYLLPAILSVIHEDNSIAMQLLFLSLLAIFTYYMSFKYLSVIYLQNFLKLLKKIEGNWRFCAWIILGFYLISILYACITSPDIALFAAFKGASLTELANLREEFLRVRTGLGKIPLYFYTICIISIIPLIITQMFLLKKPERYWVLFLFVFSLTLTLEKGRTLVALLPLIVLFLNQGSTKKTVGFLILLITIICLVSFFARGGLSHAHTNENSVLTKYNIFNDKKSQIYYLINRVVYIPYTTAIDWLDFKKRVLHGQETHGQSIGFIAWLMGKKKIYLEKEVFAFEWGQNSTGTGTANTAYYIDAYVNFGLWGIVLYSCIIAFLVKLCLASGNKAIMATLTVSLYYLCFHGLTAMLFSGGLIFLLFIALLCTHKQSGLLVV